MMNIENFTAYNAFTLLNSKFLQDHPVFMKNIDQYILQVIKYCGILLKVSSRSKLKSLIKIYLQLFSILT